MQTVNCAALADGELARLVMARREETAAAEAELCQRFARRVRGFGIRHLRDAHAADDLVQRVLLLTIEKLRAGAVREPDRLASFVLGVARMLMREGRRGGPVEVPVTDYQETLRNEGPAQSDPLAETRLVRCLEMLAERERTVLVLTYYAESSSREIGRSLGMPDGHVRVIRHRAIAQLRDCMGTDAGSGTVTP